MKKLLISFLIGIVCLFSVAPFLQAKAQTATWYDQSPSEWFLKVYDQTQSPPNEIFGERYTAAQVEWVFYGVGAFIINTLTFHNSQISACMMGAVSGTLDPLICYTAVKNTLSSFVTSLTTNLNILTKRTISANNNIPIASNQPKTLLGEVFSDKSISAVTYVKSTINKFKIPDAKAAPLTANGAGFAALSPISYIWAGFRNIAYMLFVIVTVIFAFMIMFRVKLSPQVVISVQSALPKIIIAMILVTFSFAIAGLAVDLMYIITGFVALAWSASGLDSGSPAAIFNVITGNPFFLNGIPIAGALLGGFITLLLYFLVWWLYALLAVVLVIVDAALGLSPFGALAGIVLLVMWVIFILIIVVNIFRVSYLFFKTLAQVYLLVIIAPLQIAAGTLIPSMGFGKWFRQLMASLLVFPAIGILFNFAFFFITKALHFIVISGFGLAPLVSSIFGDFFTKIWGQEMSFGWSQGGSTLSYGWSAPFMGVSPSSLPIAFIMLSMMCIMIMPKVGEILKGVIMGEKFTAGTGIGEALGPIAPVGKYAGGVVTRGAGSFAAEKYGPQLSSSIDNQPWAKKKIGKTDMGEIVKGIITGIQDTLSGKSHRGP